MTAHPDASSNAGISKKKLKPNLVLVTLTVVAAMIISQNLHQQLLSSYVAQRPGRSRGDIFLKDLDLPAAIGIWKKYNFSPPASPVQMHAEQTWISHSWKFKNGDRQAVVAFDQENWTEWHELSVCYEMQGWTLIERTIVSNSDPLDNWPFVISRFQRDGSINAILAFSFFQADGSPLPPVKRSVSELAAEFKTDVWPRLTNRVERPASTPRSVSSGRCFQCQVFLPIAAEINETVVAEVSELHQISREHFLNTWMNRANK